MINDMGIQLDDQHLVLINLGPMGYMVQSRTLGQLVHPFQLMPTLDLAIIQLLLALLILLYPLMLLYRTL